MNSKIITSTYKSRYLIIMAALIFASVTSCKTNEENSNMVEEDIDYEFTFQDPNNTVEDRVSDLLSQMTLKEKVSQMRYDAPGIERLGIPAYNWWNECLHGVARAGFATVFPQGIGMGATWNEELIHQMGVAVSDEARAKHQRFAEQGERGIYQGLTFWTPNINIFRDPRWGRGQETYGEDPYLTGRIGVNYINGLQGDDEKYYKLVATAKHFAVHSGPEKSRHQDNYKVSDKDLYETYLPAFEAAIKEANVHSVMCAYNRFRDEACCGSNLLLQKILRDDWGFDGYVVSDCWAINDFWEEDKHNIVDTQAEAGALAVSRGTDLNCGNVFDPYLNEAVLQELIDEERLDVALMRLFEARFRLGMFDPADDVKWTKISYDVVGSKKHYELSEKVARESMVLLKNTNNTLPLGKDIKSIAVIGPNANSTRALLGNYHGTPKNNMTPYKAIAEKLPNAEVVYALGADIAKGWPVLNPIPSDVLSNDNNKGLKAEYFNNRTFKGEAKLTRNDMNVDFIWMEDKPLDSLDSDDFSVRWSGQLNPTESGKYRIGFRSSNSGKMYFKDEEKFEYSNDHEPETGYFDVDLTAGESYDIKVEYYNYHTDPQAHLVWAKMNEDLLSPALEAAKQSEVVVLCLGLSPGIEGEEMPVKLEGFDKGDRSEISLPQTQVELMKAVQKLGKPTILVLMNGSALAVNWANENIPAILEAWYPGEFGGKAIADVLFGDYNPGGRLPVTFYKSVKDLPDFKNYDMDNRTYKYFKGVPLYPFGHGLSFTNFTYANLNVDEVNKDGENISVSVEVTNSGAIDGDEVVQCYISHNSANEAIRTLAGFKRIKISAGETKTVQFNITPKQYRKIADDGSQSALQGSIEISLGGKQPGFVGTADTKSTQVINKKIKVE